MCVMFVRGLIEVIDTLPWSSRGKQDRLTWSRWKHHCRRDVHVNSHCVLRTYNKKGSAAHVSQLDGSLLRPAGRRQCLHSSGLICRAHSSRLLLRRRQLVR